MTAANPYVGARPFTSQQRVFGRDRERREILDLLIAERIVLLHAPSGAGKSSLIQGGGGLADALRDEGFHVLPAARVGLPPPEAARSNRYTESLLASIERDGEAAPASAGAGRGAPLDVHLRRLAARHDEAVGTVLIVDQLEEALTVEPIGELERVAFFRELGRALENGRMWALFALREDYLGALAPYRALLPLRLRTTYRLDLLERAAAKEAIVRPAQGAGVPFTDAAVDRLLNELCTVAVPRRDGTAEQKPGSTVEPVQLQVVCHRIWLRREPGVTRIDEEHIDACASVGAALSDYYTAAIEAAARVPGARERRLREWVERELITPAGVRSQVMRYGEAGDGVPDDAIQRLIDAYVVRQDTRRAVQWVELAHDRLVDPIRQSNAAWRIEHLHVAQLQAALWDERGRGDELCLKGAELAEAERWAAEHEGELTDVEAQFLEDCRRLEGALRERGRRRRRRWAAAAMIVAAALASTLGFLEWRRRETREALLVMAAREQLALGQPAWAMKLLLAVKHPEKRRGWIELANEAAVMSAPAATLRGHGDRVAFAAFSPDGRRIVTASWDRTARIWSADGSGDPVVLRGHDAAIVWAAFSPGGERVATASLDGTARVWRADGAGAPVVLRGHEAAVVSVAFSPDGGRVVTASSDGAARVWRADGAGAPVVLRGHEVGVVSAAFSPDGGRVVTASFDGTARVWPADGAGAPVVLRGHEAPLVSAAFSPGGEDVVTASFDATARVWRADGAGAPVVLRGHEKRLAAAAFSPDGRRVVTAAADTTVRVWRADGAGEPVILKSQEGAALSVAFSPDGRRVLAASWDGVARVWNADGAGEPVVLRGHGEPVQHAAFSPDGQRVVTASWDRTARVWNANGSSAPVFRVGKLVYSAVFSPEGERIAAGIDDQTARIWDLGDPGKPPIVLEGHAGYVGCVAFSPDGRRVVTASGDATARIWNADGTGEPVVLRGHAIAVFSAAFSPDGRRVVTTSWDRTARIWNADGTGRPIVLRGHEGTVSSAAFSPDGRRVVTASDDLTARVWDADGSGEPIVLQGHGDRLFDAAFSPDGQRIVTASADLTARVWSADGSGEPVVLEGHLAQVRSAAFSPDGRRVVTASEDLTVRLWNVDGSGEPIVLRGHLAQIRSANFSPDGEQIVTASRDGTVRVFSVAVPRLRRHLESFNADCVPPALRRTYLDETAAQAGDRYDLCERAYGRTPFHPLPLCMAGPVWLEAGPLGGHEDARAMCPATCEPTFRWEGRWRSTVPGAMGVCACAPRAAEDHDAGAFYGLSAAIVTCPHVCALHDQVWTRSWENVTPEMATVCSCSFRPPATLELEAGPLSSDEDAEESCPEACGDDRRWSGVWRSTVPDRMAVCGCSCRP